MLNKDQQEAYMYGFEGSKAGRAGRAGKAQCMRWLIEGFTNNAIILGIDEAEVIKTIDLEEGKDFEIIEPKQIENLKQQ